MKSVSVIALNGIRLSMTMRSGCLSCMYAYELSTTKMFSRFNISMAGSPSGNLRCIIPVLLLRAFLLLYHLQKIRYKDND